MQLMPQNDHVTGAAMGGILGFVKSLTMISMISWATVLDTVILSGTGTLVGLVVTALYKWIKQKFSK